MTVTFELQRQFTFEELCQFILTLKDTGIGVIEYMLNNSGDNELYLYAADSCEEHEVFIDQDKLTLKQFESTEVMEYYNLAVRLISETDNNKENQLYDE